jgi:hypothetical protein
MDAAEQTTIFALLSVVFFVISLFADDERWWISVGCTGVLVCYWALNTILWILRIVEDFSLVSDLVFTIALLALALNLRRLWLMSLCALFMLNLLLDGLHLWGLIDYGAWAEAGNITFVCQLGTASFPGLLRITRSLTGRITSTSVG